MSIKIPTHEGPMADYPQSFGPGELSDLLEFITFSYKEPMPLIESLDGRSGIFIRHDVDHSIEHALKFAEWEKEHGIRSTYFILHSAPYYNYINTLEYMNEISFLGHEVGIHHDFFSETEYRLSTLKPFTLEELIAETKRKFEFELEMLEECDFHIKGCAAHGGRGKISNMSFWDYYTPEDFGLEYEAYHLSRKANSLISDNHGEWNGPLALSDKGPQTFISIHPEHWELS